MKKVIDRGKRSKTLSEVKPVENISKNLQSFLEISPVQKILLPLHKLRDHAYEYQNTFGLKEDNLSQRNCQNELSHHGLSHTEQECQENLIQGKICKQKNLNKGLKLSFRELSNSKLSGLQAFDYMAIYHSLKLASDILYQTFIFYQMIALQKLCFYFI